MGILVRPLTLNLLKMGTLANASARAWNEVAGFCLPRICPPRKGTTKCVCVGTCVVRCIFSVCVFGDDVCVTENSRRQKLLSKFGSFLNRFVVQRFLKNKQTAK